MQGRRAFFVAHILLFIFRCGSKKWTHVSSPVTNVLNTFLSYFGYSFKSSRAVFTRRRFCSGVSKCGIQRAVKRLSFSSSLRILNADATHIRTMWAMSVTVYLASLAIRSRTFRMFLGVIAECSRPGLGEKFGKGLLGNTTYQISNI